MMSHHHDLPAKRLRILVVEDNVDAALTIKDLLELEGDAVRVVHSGRMALEEIRQWHPQVVLCDIGLPDMDGYQVAAEIRRDVALANVYLIALSGYSDDEDRWRSAKEGFDLHLVKPMDPDQLQAVLDQLRTRQ